MVRECIERHITSQALQALREAEASEREDLLKLARQWGGDPDADTDDDEE
jgi:hypothetical protein